MCNFLITVLRSSITNAPTGEGEGKGVDGVEREGEEEGKESGRSFSGTFNKSCR